jgi:hypothetical protein
MSKHKKNPLTPVGFFYGYQFHLASRLGITNCELGITNCELRIVSYK